MQVFQEAFDRVENIDTFPELLIAVEEHRQVGKLLDFQRLMLRPLDEVEKSLQKFDKFLEDEEAPSGVLTMNAVQAAFNYLWGTSFHNRGSVYCTEEVFQTVEGIWKGPKTHANIYNDRGWTTGSVEFIRDDKFGRDMLTMFVNRFGHDLDPRFGGIVLCRNNNSGRANVIGVKA